MGTILSVFVIGVSFGLVLFLLATGLSLTMGLMRIINLAHGALYMVGAYVGWSVATHAHNFWLGIIAGAACAGAIGLLLEVGFLRRLYKQPTSQVLLSIGFIYILTNVTQWIWGTYPGGQVVPNVFSGSVALGSVDIPVFRLFVIGFGLVMAALLWLLQDKTRIGAVVRAGMDSRDIAGALGINLRGVFTGVFALGALIAGLCGLIGAPTTGINLGVAWDALLLSMIVVVVGGTGSIQGALLGGVLIGLINAFGTAYFPQVAYFLVYGALIIILLVRPWGLLGKKAYVAPGGQEAEKPAKRKRKAMAGVAEAPLGAGQVPAWRAALHRWVPCVFVLVVLGLVPQMGGSYFQGMITKVLVFAMFAMSLDLTMGYCGLISFGHASFLGIAGYTVGVLTTRTGITSFWLVLVIALVITAALAAVIGYITLRVSGVYFLLVTMAFGQVLASIATKWYSLTGGTDGLVGIPKPELGVHIDWTATKFYYMVFIVFIICFFLLRLVVRSSFGRTLVGIRINEERMLSLGFNTWRMKYVAVIVGGTFAGLAGIFYAYFYGNMVPAYVALQTSSLPMLMVILGGRGTLWGPCLGAAVIVLVQQYAGIYLPERWPLILGAIFVLCVMLLKGGIARYLMMGWDRVGLLKARPALSDPTPEEAQP